MPVVEDLTKKCELLEEEIESLKEQVEWFKRNLFGSKSERIIKDLNSDQLSFLDFNEEDFEQESKPSPKKGGRRRSSKSEKVKIPEDVPVETRILDVPESEKICPITKQPLKKIGEEKTYKLAFKPGIYFVIEYLRPKYASPNAPENGVSIADLPQSIITPCLADESLLAEILVRKYTDHLPLYRQSEIFYRDGVTISRKLMSQWTTKIGLSLEPLYEALRKKILESKNVFIDETPVSMQEKGKGKVHQAYMWVLVGGHGSDPPLCYYDFKTNRKHINAEEILKGYQGVFHSDKYGCYPILAEKEEIIWSPCFSHIRRKFLEAESGDLEFRDWVLRKLRYLFLLERVAWNRSAEERVRIRREKEEPILDDLIKKITDKQSDLKILPKSKLRIAINYFCDLIPHLKNYTTNPSSRIDNNVAERAVRPLAVGRKNWLFVGSQNGGKG